MKAVLYRHIAAGEGIALASGNDCNSCVVLMDGTRRLKPICNQIKVACLYTKK